MEFRIHKLLAFLAQIPLSMKTCCFFTLTLLFLLTWAESAFGQSATNPDSVFVFTLLEKANENYSNSQYEAAHLLCEKAINYANEKSYSLGLAYSFLKKSEIYIDQDSLDLAKVEAENAAVLAQKIHNPEVQAISDLLIAQTLMYNNQTKDSFRFFEKSINEHFALNHSTYAALAFNDYGYALGTQGETEKQIANLIQALDILEEVSPDNSAELAITLNNISIAFYTMQQMEKAIEYAKLSLVHREKTGDISRLSLGYCNLSQFYRGIDPDSVEKYLKLCEQYAEQSGDEARMTQAYITTALLYSDKNDRENALDYELKAIELMERRQNDPSMLSRRYISAGMHAMALEKDSVTIMDYFNKSIDQNQVVQSKFNFRDVYNQLSVFYKSQNDFQKAYDYYALHILYRDSIIQENTVSNIAELETKYETEKKDNEILQLQSTQQIRELQLEKQNAILAGNILEAAQKQKEIELLTQTKELNELEITQQNEEIIKQNLLTQNKEQQLILAEQEALIQDKELRNSKIFRNLSFLVIGMIVLISYFLFNRYQLKRKIEEQASLLAVRGNIAKDLHDEIGSTLTSIKILSEVSSKRLNQDATQVSPFLKKITEQSASAQQGMSDIIWAINPENDKLQNMVVRMREYVTQTLESKSILITMDIREDILNKTIDMSQRRDFLLLFKEVINNITKHAEAKSVKISLFQKDQYLTIQIEDDGIGFDPEKKRSSNGLKNMKSRVQALEGHLNIKSKIGEGTVVTITLNST